MQLFPMSLQGADRPASYVATGRELTTVETGAAGVGPRSSAPTSAPGAPLAGTVRMFYTLHKRLFAGFRRELEAHGLSSDDLAVLQVAAAAGEAGVTLSTVAAEIDVSTGGLTRMINRLCRHGLLERRPSTSDRRVAYAVITGQGSGVLTDILERGLPVVDRSFVDDLTAVCSDLELAVRAESDAGPISPA